MEREMVTAVPTSAGGTSLAAVGDVNGDGIDDFLAGGTGAAYLFFGSATALPGTPGVTFVGSGAAFFGNGVAGVGDLNADGIADFAISAFGANSFAGAVYVFFGHNAMTAWPPTIDVDLGGCAADLCLRSDDGMPGAGPDEFAFLGSSIANAGDFDGDGIADLVIGAPGANTVGSTYPGAVYVLRGSATLGGVATLPGTAATTISGFVINVPPGFQQLGTAVAGLGNVGGGPGDDLALGAAGNAPAEGGIFTVLGRAHPGTGIVAIAPAELGIVNRGAPNTLGSTVVNAGDVDNNGMVDVGSYETLHPGGQATYYLGVGGGYTASSARLLQNDSVDRASDSFGRFIGTGVHTSPLVGATGILGDLDRDGRADLLVGATQLDTMPAAGQLYYSGLVSELPAVARSLAHATFSPATAEAMPFRIPQFVGDVNGDGFLDLAVGDPDHLADTGRVVVYY
ncbi:MAG: FG-GAP repeat protein [Deltaproteobacteria bacterium]|nr:FG-GAP repeat protein [Deltaproteobacteria bacterium]